MTYSRLVFTSRASVPSDWYRADSPPWLPLSRRVIPSRDSRVSDAYSDIHLVISPTIAAIYTPGENSIPTMASLVSQKLLNR